MLDQLLTKIKEASLVKGMPRYPTNKRELYLVSEKLIVSSYSPRFVTHDREIVTS